MRKNIKLISKIILAVIFAAGFFYPLFPAKAASFNNDPADRQTLLVSNYTKCPACANWASSVNADAGDIVSFVVYYHNTSNETATGTAVKITLPSGNSMIQSVSGSVWAQNAPMVNGNVSVKLSSSQSLSFISGSVRWYPDGSSSYQLPPFGQTGAEIIAPAGLNIGDVAPSWGTAGYVVVRVQVSGVPVPPASAPTVNTNSATNIYQNSATLNGSINPNSAYTNAWFEYGTTQSLGTAIGTQSIGNGTTAINLSYSLSNLTANTTYYYRAVGSNFYGTNYGAIQSFVTGTGGGGLSAPFVSTLSATNIGNNTAALNAAVNPNNSNTNLWFEYGTTQSLGYTSGYQWVGSGNWNTNITAYISNLTANTTYYYRVVASNSYGTTYGSILSFNSGGAAASGNAPVVTTSPATYVYKNSALLNGAVNPNNSLTNAWYEWGTTAALGKTTTFQPMGSGTNVYNYSFALSGLTSGATYYFRAVAQNQYGITYGNILSFTALGGVVYQPSAPTVIIRETAPEKLVEIIPSLDVTEPKAGEEINLTVIYRNNNSKPITNGVLKIVLPNETSYVSSNPQYNSRDESLLTFNLGKIEAKTQGSVNVKVKVDKTADKGDSLIFTATLEYTDPSDEFQTISAYLTAVVKEDLSLLALSLGVIAGLLKKWWFDLLLGLAAGLTIYHFFIKKEPEQLEMAS